MKQAAALIYASYPDYGKAPEEFVTSVMLHLATYYATPWVLDALADRKTGIATTTLLMPSVYQIAEFAKKAINERAKADDHLRRFGHRRDRRPVLAGPRVPFRPYPRLWEAFAGEPEIIQLLDDSAFDRMTEASRTFAARGIDAARLYIRPEADPRYADLPDRA